MITELVPVTYGMVINNIDHGKRENGVSKYSFINLRKLAENSPKDVSWNDNIPYYQLPAFVSTSTTKHPIYLVITFHLLDLYLLLLNVLFVNNLDLDIIL